MSATAAVMPEWKLRFDLDGFINYGQILAGSELRALQERLDGICRGEVEVPRACVRLHAGMSWERPDGSRDPGAVWQLLGLEKHDAAFRTVCELPSIRGILETLLEGPARLWSS
ncbi:MAG: hypothetical protein M5U26_29450 [Planctomycetota bacterium]|nr:hypothetical protein [Planctomycetota bacterium]